MLIMLNPLPDFPKSPEYELTLLTFPLPEAFFREYGFDIIDIINISPVGSKNYLWQGQC